MKRSPDPVHCHGNDVPGPRRAVVRWLWIMAFLAVGLLLRENADAQTPFIGQIQIFAGTFAPTGWMFCEGQTLPISQYSALFSLLGTMYGGDGITTFALPDLRGRVTISTGQGPGLSSRVVGEKGGTEMVSVFQSQIPSHSHTVSADSLPGSSDLPAGAIPADAPDGVPAFGVTPGRVMPGAALELVGGGQPHNNVKPYVAIRYIIAVEGIFPSRN